MIDLPGLEAVLRVADALRGTGLRGVIDIVPAARTVLVRCVDRAAVRRVEAAVRSLDASARPVTAPSREVRIDVHYDGPDLADVAELAGLSVETVVAAHSGTPWRAAFGGFAPGFAYLAEGDPRLTVPRLATPRTAVPAGSVAVASGFSAVYPGASPGGWRLLGRAAAEIWDPAREEPALIAPGDTVRFSPVRERIRAAASRRPADAFPGHPPVRSAHLDAPAGAAEAPAGEVGLRIEDPGLLALVQDLGRPGRAAIGVTESGAMDRAALERANRAVGNPPAAAGIECLNGGLVVRAERTLIAAVAGAACELRIEDPGGGRRVVLADAPFELRGGQTLRLGDALRGLRCYLAVRGGIAGPSELGSLAHDSLSGLGTAPLRTGDALRVGAEPASPVGGPQRAPAACDGPAVLRLVPGPRNAWFAAGELDRLCARVWRATPQSNRIGVRLAAEDGSAGLQRVREGELPSEGAVRGALQVPPSGLPVLFLADHPVTGGYPVIGVVVDEDLDLAGQLRPGDPVRFRAVGPDAIEPRRPAAQPSRFDAAVEVTFEVDGRRRALRLPPAVAETVERALEAAGDAALAEILIPLLRLRREPRLRDVTMGEAVD